MYCRISPALPSGLPYRRLGGCLVWENEADEGCDLTFGHRLAIRAQLINLGDATNRCRPCDYVTRPHF